MTDEREYVAEVLVGQDDADQEEYPTCYRCGSPRIFFVHTDAIGYIKTCTNPECHNGLENKCDRQIPGTMVKKCVEETGMGTLREQLHEQFEVLNEYREEQGLDPVELPEARREMAA